MAASPTIGDIWAAFDQANIVPVGAALGHALVIHKGQSLRIANRGFVDNRVAPTSVLNQVKAWGLNPVASSPVITTLNRVKADFRASRQRQTATSGFLTMADTADPGITSIPNVDAVSGYLGGWTPHIWTITQWKAQTVPCQVGWTYNPNKPGSTQGTLDGQAALAKAKSLGVTEGTAISIDMEASQDPAYCLAFRNAVRGTYWTRIYGSASAIFANWATPDGPGGGWHVAQWTGVPHMFSDGVHTNIWSTQYADATMANLPWDMNTIVDTSHLWNTHLTSYFVTVTATSSGGSSKKSTSFAVSR